MSEHWKSTPKYWCKHCATFVRDTKLERTNHEATGKHQGAVKRALSNLHRAAATEDREKERARREIERLNGVVNPSSRAGGRGEVGGEAERKRQAEQLAALGVALPEPFRKEVAMPGEWSVTSTTIVEERAEGEGGEGKMKAKGVHKRERTEEEKEHEAAVNGLFKKPRRWGRDTAHKGGEESEELDLLLSGGLGLVVKKQEEEEEEGKGVVKSEVKEEGEPSLVKNEPEDEGAAGGVPADIPVADAKADGLGVDGPSVKSEDGKVKADAAEVPVVAFKKRKAKNVRQK